MAGALAADIKENILTCNICLGEYEDPRVLPCYHTFCYGCISDHATRTLTPNRTFLCPICREKLQFPAGGLNQLKKNFSFSKTKDIITKQQERQTLEEEQANVAAVTQAIAQMTISCEKHPDNELKYYCEDDNTVICGKCIATGHGGHRISSVMQVAKINKDKIKTALERTMKTTNRFKEALETANKTDDPHIKTHTIKNIKKQTQNVRKFIDQREETLISEVNSAYDNWKKQKEATKGILEFHHASLHSACDFAQELIANGTDSEIMLHAKPLIVRLAVMEKTPVPTPDTPAHISYIPGKIYTAGLKAMLGQVTEELQLPLPGQGTNPRSAPNLPVFFEKAKCMHSFCPRLKGDIIFRIYGLAVDEQYTYVVDQYNSWLWNARTKLFTHDGELKFDFKLNNPFDIAVSQTGHLFITSRVDKCVKVYSTRDIDWVKSCVHVLSPTGNPLYQYGEKGSEPLSPCGVCTDSYGQIFIADNIKHRIVVLSPQGQFFRYIATKADGLNNPVALAINPAGQLVVAEEDGMIKTFQYS
ncbi:tripartite motif-containing protein 2-like [Lingula anatina]|uniref:Tripartite motif-containing protein 2-like n=1 Tax=Lingula anatina TaxID=7574 RepID=A0A1S3IC16_LINAN|nr:tripartite motif-containing protein 2-like [Lingula anatina]|eukprot:XP_013395800.1 tripartite motif-containing protein 2-like [Lingula anatina]